MNRPLKFSSRDYISKSIYGNVTGELFENIKSIMYVNDSIYIYIYILYKIK